MSLDSITLDIMWGRMIATVNEQAAALMRSSLPRSSAMRAISRPACSTGAGAWSPRAVTGLARSHQFHGDGHGAHCRDLSGRYAEAR